MYRIGHQIKAVSPLICNLQRIAPTLKLPRYQSTITTQGPLSLYNSYLEKKVLKPDACQLRAVSKLQDLYERVKDYNPIDKPESTATEKTKAGELHVTHKVFLHLYISSFYVLH